MATLIKRITRYQEHSGAEVQFAVTMEDGREVYTDAARLLSYRRFQADVLEQLGEVFRCTWIAKDTPWDDIVERYLVKVKVKVE